MEVQLESHNVQGNQENGDVNSDAGYGGTGRREEELGALSGKGSM